MSATPELEAGTLDRRVSLLAPVYNAAGDEIDSWQKVTDVWAAIVPTSAVEGNASARNVTQTYVQITMRYRTDIDPRWRIVDAPITYEIEGLVSPLARRAGLRMYAKEVR